MLLHVTLQLTLLLLLASYCMLQMLVLLPRQASVRHKPEATHKAVLPLHPPRIYVENIVNLNSFLRLSYINAFFYIVFTLPSLPSIENFLKYCFIIEAFGIGIQYIYPLWWSE